MATSSKFQVAAPRAPIDPAKVAAFAQGANAPHAVTPQEEQGAHAPVDPTYWATLDNKRRGGINVFNIRFTDREAAQLKHITEKTNLSRHEFCLKAVQEAIARELQQ